MAFSMQYAQDIYHCGMGTIILKVLGLHPPLQKKLQCRHHIHKQNVLVAFSCYCYFAFDVCHQVKEEQKLYFRSGYSKEQHSVGYLEVKR